MGVPDEHAATDGKARSIELAAKGTAILANCGMLLFDGFTHFPLKYSSTSPLYTFRSQDR